MADGTQLSMTEDGRLAVTKRGAPGPGADRLRREADILGRAAHPGVVEVLAVDDLDGGTVLHIAFVGGGTLAEHLGTLGVVRGARVAATLAATLADLHERGIAHQRVTADHVLVTDDDHVRLCGVAEASMSSDAAPCHPLVAAVDVDAVATLVREIAGEATGAGAAALRRVADRARAGEPAARPSMRTLARALAAVTGQEDVSSPPVAHGRRLLPVRPPLTTRRLRPTRRHAVIGLLVVVAVLVASAVMATDTAGPGPSAPPVAAPAPPPPDSHQSTTTVAVPTSTPEPPAVRVWPPDPRPEPEVIVMAGGVVSVAGRRWQVARSDDHVVVGDWDCDGTATPAVVRSGTGGVWVFDRWAEGSDEVVAAPAGTVPGAVSASAVAVAGADGAAGRECHDLEVVGAAGETTRLDLASS